MLEEANGGIEHSENQQSDVSAAIMKVSSQKGCSPVERESQNVEVTLFLVVEYEY